VKRLIEKLGLENLFLRSDLKPVVILLLPAFLLTIHRYYGSIEFAEAYFPSFSRLHATYFMFSTAFFLLGFIPLTIVLFLFRESPKEYGIQFGDWKFGITAVLVLFPLIAGLLLFPSSFTPEMKEFYPFDKGAGNSVFAFLRLEIPRGLLYYSAWEFFFRGFMLFGLRKRMGDWLAICIQTLPSVLWHIGMPSGEIFASIFGGILFGILALRTRSILWPLLLHFLIGVGLDFFIVILS
jgi:membrane protease YdiL (CAAX protease family)